MMRRWALPLADYLGDVVFDIDVTPNMIRIASIIGVAREVCRHHRRAAAHAPIPTWQTQRLRLPATTAMSKSSTTTSATASPPPSSAMCRLSPRPSGCSTACKLVGQRPISNLVDVTNYVMFEWGKPLHAFDYDRLLARAQSVGKDKVKIIVRRAEDGEAFTTLDDAKRILDSDVLMICDEAGPVGIGGVMGGLDTEISDTHHQCPARIGLLQLHQHPPDVPQIQVALRGRLSLQPGRAF